MLQQPKRKQNFPRETGDPILYCDMLLEYRDEIRPQKISFCYGGG